MPVEIPDAIPFESDHTHASYDPDSVNRFWRILVAGGPAAAQFRSGFLGKVSPCIFSG